MNGKQLSEWRRLMGFNQNQAATALGYGRRQYQKMERGKEGIKQRVELACAALANGIVKYDMRAHREKVNQQKGNKNV